MLSSTTTEWLTGRPKWLQVAPARRLFESGQLNKAAIGEPAALCKQAANNKFPAIQHIDMEDLGKDFPTYVLHEHFLPKLKDKKPDAKALDIEAAPTAELRIRLDQDKAFRPLSEKLQRIIDEKRAGTLADIALLEDLESLTEAVLPAVEEAKPPIAQQLALKIKNRNVAITEAQAAEVARRHTRRGGQRLLPRLLEFQLDGPGTLQGSTPADHATILRAGAAGRRPHGVHRPVGAGAQPKHYKPGSKDA